MKREDFVVREDCDLALSTDGPHRVYLMHKRGWNTVDAVGAIARASGVPVHEVRYAGLKDRHAVTSQYVTVPGRYALLPRVPGIPEEDLRFETVGFSQDFVSTRNLVKNRFFVVLRSLSQDEVAVLNARLPNVRAFGFPNYFDDQRFGSVPPGGELLAERVAKGHLKGALRLYMTADYPGLGVHERARREKIAQAWGDWPTVTKESQGVTERRITESLLEGGGKKNLLAALNAIPHTEMTMHLAAFQAALWNRALTLLLKPEGNPTTPRVPGRVGDYLFPPASFDLQGVNIPTAARHVLPCTPDVAAAITTSLVERGLKPGDLNLRGIRNGYLKSFYRSAVVIPGGMEVGNPLPDELYAGREKVSLSFDLPPGSYATMLIKALTATA